MVAFEDETRVLLVGDDGSIREALTAATADAGDAVVQTTDTQAETVEALEDPGVDCLVDGRVGAEERIEFLAAVREAAPDLPSLFVTGSPELADDALGAGATDVVVFHDGASGRRLVEHRLDALLERETRQRHEQRLVAERDATDQLLDAIDDIFYLLGTDGTLGRWNESLCRVTGYTDEQVDGMDALEFFPPEHRDRIADAIDEALESGSTTVEAEMVTSAGERVPVEFTGASVVDDGRPRGIVGIGRDITERKEREHDLKLAETVFEGTQDAVFVVDVGDDGEFRILRVNPAYESVTDMDAVEMRGQTPTDIVGAEHGQRIEARYRECVERAEPISYEEELPIDGQRRFWQTRVAPVSEDGEVTRLVGATRDITERKEREDELAYRTALQEAVSENTVDGLLVVDDGDVLYHNERFREMWNIPEEVAATQSDDELLAAVDDLLVDPENYLEKVQYLYEHPEEESHETVRLTDGRWFDRYSAPVVDDGTHYGRLWVFRDVTERKEREQELELKNRAMDEAPIGITIHDATAEDAPIAYANDGFVELTGYAHDAVEGETVDAFAGAETDEARLADLRQAVDGGEDVSVVVLLYRKDGAPFWARVSLAPVTDGADEVTHVVGFLQDVSEIKESEQTVARRLNEFGEVLAEDLRTPLQSATEELQTARDTGDEADIEAAIRSLERVDSLVEDLTTVHAASVKSRETVDALDDGGDL